MWRGKHDFKEQEINKITTESLQCIANTICEAVDNDQFRLQRNETSIR